MDFTSFFILPSKFIFFAFKSLFVLSGKLTSIKSSFFTFSDAELINFLFNLIFFDNIIHIQASWPTMGLDIAQLALTGGADDAGSTMMEENVVSASGTSKTMASEIELQKIILRSGFSPRKRDSDYVLIETEIITNTDLFAVTPKQ